MDFRVLIDSVPVGDYVSIVKVIAVLVVAMVWWRLLTWLDKDAPAAHLPRELINLLMMGGFALGFVLLLLLPGFWIGFPAFIVCLLGEVGAYLIIRNQKVGLADVVSELKNFKPFGAGGGKKTPKVVEVAGEANLATKDGRHMQAPDPEAPERQIYDTVQMMVTEPLRRGMERLELLAVDQNLVTQYWVDGVVYTGPQFTRAASAGAIGLLKRLAGMDLNEKRKPQAGMMQMTVDGKRHDVRVQTAGSASGESLRLLVDPKHRHDLRLEQIGLSPDQLEHVTGVVRDAGGLVLLAVPKGQGLTSLCYAVIRQHDAFLTQIATIERDPEDDLEGITQNALPRSASPQDEFEKVQWVVSQEPDAILMTSVQNPKSVRELIGHAASGKRVYVALKSASAVDAINDWRALVGDDELAMKELRLVIAGRVVRKLCPACKQPYQPDPETLRKLNLDHGKAQQFYQARTQPMVDQKGNPIPCTFCAEMRFKGRTGVYEVMEVNDEVRQAVLQNASAKQLIALFRKMRGRFVQEQALDLVESGQTSIQEVSRAMRGQEQDPAAARAASSATGSFSSATGTGPAGTRAGSTAGGTRAAVRPTGRPTDPGRNR